MTVIVQPKSHMTLCKLQTGDVSSRNTHIVVGLRYKQSKTLYV